MDVEGVREGDDERGRRPGPREGGRVARSVRSLSALQKGTHRLPGQLRRALREFVAPLASHGHGGGFRPIAPAAPRAWPPHMSLRQGIFVNVFRDSGGGGGARRSERERERGRARGSEGARGSEREWERGERRRRREERDGPPLPAAAPRARARAERGRQPSRYSSPRPDVTPPRGDDMAAGNL